MPVWHTLGHPGIHRNRYAAPSLPIEGPADGSFASPKLHPRGIKPPLRFFELHATSVSGTIGIGFPTLAFVKLDVVSVPLHFVPVLLHAAHVLLQAPHVLLQAPHVLLHGVSVVLRAVSASPHGIIVEQTDTFVS